MRFRDDDTTMISCASRRLRALALASGMLLAAGAPLCALADQRVLSDFQPCASQYELPAQLAERAQCATLNVPENRAAPNGRMLALPIVRLPTSDQSPGEPVFVLNGGPGEANLSGVKPLVQVGRKHDVYYVGYRGAEGSTVLQCPEVNAHLEPAEIFSSTNLKRLEAAGGACARRLKQSGVNLLSYTMLDVIDDLEAARSALGYEKINLFSISYGTRVAQYYARRHPQRIFRSVMVGANPPGHFVFSARVNDQILSRLSQLCTADASCSSRTDNLQSTVLKAVHRSEKPGAAQVDDGRSRLGLFFAMYRRDSFRAFADAAIAAERGDWSSLTRLGEAATEGLKETIWGDLLSKGVLDTYRYAELESTFAATAVSMGSPLDLVYQAVSKHWPRAPFPEQYHRAAPDPTQTLVINGDIDVATPLAFVEAELMPQLPNGKLLALKDYGHGDIGRQGSAFDQIIAQYLATGQLVDSALQRDPYAFGFE